MRPTAQTLSQTSTSGVSQSNNRTQSKKRPAEAGNDVGPLKKVVGRTTIQSVASDQSDTEALCKYSIIFRLLS